MKALAFHGFLHNLPDLRVKQKHSHVGHVGQSVVQQVGDVTVRDLLTRKTGLIFR